MQESRMNPLENLGGHSPHVAASAMAEHRPEYEAVEVTKSAAAGPRADDKPGPVETLESLTSSKLLAKHTANIERLA